MSCFAIVRMLMLAGSLLGLASCVNRGPDRLSSCLSDSTFMPRYLSSANPYRFMVAGIGAGGEASCFWSEGRLFQGIYASDAWGRCKEVASECTVMAQGDKVIFNADFWFQTSRLRETVPGPTPRDEVAHAIWYLVGEFANGLAMGIGAAAVQPAPTTIAIGRLEMRCTPTGAIVSNAPAYVCR